MTNVDATEGNAHRYERSALTIELQALFAKGSMPCGELAKAETPKWQRNWQRNPLARGFIASAKQPGNAPTPKGRE